MILINTSSVFAQIPVINIETENYNFIPSKTYKDWSYYVNPQGTDFTNSKIVFKGYTGTQNSEYTYISNNARFSYSAVDLERNNQIHNNLLSDNLRQAANPFIAPENYPRAVRVQSTFNPIFEYPQKNAISLHMDHSFSFMAEEDVTYFGYLNTSDSFFLDVEIFDGNAYGRVDFPDAFPNGGHYVGNIEKRMSYPFFPRSNSGNSASPLNFTIILYEGSLVTLTPHPLDFPNYVPVISVNTTFSGNIDQGDRQVIDEEVLIYPDNEFFSLRMFNLSFTKNNFYEIFVNFRTLEYSSFTSGEPFAFLISEKTEAISSTTINQDGHRLYAPENTSGVLVLFAQGWSIGEYSIYYQNYYQEPEILDIAPLIFDKDISMDYDHYYTFTFESPHMVAVNYSDYHYFYLYMPGSQPNEWIQVGSAGNFNPEYGMLTGDYLTDIGNNWLYFPAGTYAIKLSWYYSWGKIHFTKVPVISPQTVTVTKDSIFAFELPLTKNRINFVNISTNDHIYPYQRVLYEYGWVGKYAEMIRNVYYPGSSWLGNRNDTSQWLEWDSNNTVLDAFLPTRTYETPILMIRPYSVENSTFQNPSSLSASLTVSTNVAAVQHYTQNSWSAIGGGHFIPKASTTSTTSFNVNDDVFNQTDHVYGIPLALQQNRIYNISVKLTGNYTNNALNATIQDMNIHGGNLQNLEIFNSKLINSDQTRYWSTMLILTVTNNPYLYLDIYRTYDGLKYRNATLKIYIEEITRQQLEFDLELNEYNATPLPKEEKQTNMLASMEKASEMNRPRRSPGYEFFLVLGTLILFVKRKKSNRRKQ
ncbi:MAG: hypothetical protein ACXAD7_26315 [Candidatus Kariarchaeaceae archaeon]|jgi:hypothetical protein